MDTKKENQGKTNKKVKKVKESAKKRHIFTMIFIFIILGLQGFIIYDLYNVKDDFSDQLRIIKSLKYDVSTIDVNTDSYDFSTIMDKLEGIESDVSDIEDNIGSEYDSYGSVLGELSKIEDNIGNGDWDDYGSVLYKLGKLEESISEIKNDISEIKFQTEPSYIE